jgi:CRISPR system Cascade subunit CasB
MTTDPALATPQRVGAITGVIIGPLQEDYLDDRPYAVAALARLRRGAGKEAAQVPDLWGLADTGALYEQPPARRPLSEDELIHAEDAVHVALTLWALHQQSRRKAMHRADRRTAPMGFGAAVRRLMPRNEIDEPVRKRFVRVGNAPDLAAMSLRLRDVVLLLRREDIELDYVLLAEQLYRWQEPGGRDLVRRAWGRSFHAYQAPEGSGTDDSPTDASPATTDATDTADASATTDATDTIDKDAS